MSSPSTEAIAGRRAFSTGRESGQNFDANPRGVVRLRTWTYPYECALAICSDLDETPNRHVYLEIARYLNTTEATVMGPGVGLEVGNSIYFDMPPNQFAYWTTDDAGRAMIRDLIRSGHIDVLHSYGDFCDRRPDVERYLGELRRHDLQLEVWVDHSKAPTNFGPDIMAGGGDVTDAEAYHADLTLAYGIRYVWRGRTTGITGQDAPLSPRAYADFWTPRRPLASVRTAIKEAVKAHLGRRGHSRWEMYAANRIYRASALRDGRRIWEFLRSNPYWGGSGAGDTADGIAEVLTPRMLETLMRRRGACILCTHLGKVGDPGRPFGPAARAAFRRLAEFHQAGRVLVRSTHRLLRYLNVRDHLKFREAWNGEIMSIEIDEVADPVFGSRPPSSSELQGLTFELPRCAGVTVRGPDGAPLACDVIHRGEATLAALPWGRLEFPRTQW